MREVENQGGTAQEAYRPYFAKLQWVMQYQGLGRLKKETMQGIFGTAACSQAPSLSRSRRQGLEVQTACTGYGYLWFILFDTA